MISDLGTAPLGVMVPGAVAACAIAAPNVQAQVSAMAEFIPSANVDFGSQLTMAGNAVANIQAAIALGIQPPSLEVQADLGVEVSATINANLAIILKLMEFLGTAGVRALVYSGPKEAFGSELGTALGAGSESCHGIVLAAFSDAIWAAMQGILKTG